MKATWSWLRTLKETGRPGSRGEAEVRGRKIQNPNSKDQGNSKLQISKPDGREWTSGADALCAFGCSGGRPACRRAVASRPA